MLFSKNTVLAATMVVGSLVIAGCSSSSSNTNGSSKALAPATDTPMVHTRKIPPYVKKTGEVILLRGLANVFSKGMDVIGDKLKAKGVDARVYNHASWEDLARDIIARSKQKKVSYPIVIMGHSLGGNASIQMATVLGKAGIPVSYVVTFDPTEPRFAGPKIKRVVNYYLPNGRNTVRKGPGFRGKLSNVNVSNIRDITHTTVEKTPKLQNRAIGTVMKLVRPLPKKRRKRG